MAESASFAGGLHISLFQTSELKDYRFYLPRLRSKIKHQSIKGKGESESWKGNRVHPRCRPRVQCVLPLHCFSNATIVSPAIHRRQPLAKKVSEVIPTIQPPTHAVGGSPSTTIGVGSCGSGNMVGRMPRPRIFVRFFPGGAGMG